MVVPYTSNYETPLKQYLTDLDKEMSEILQLNIPGDEKLKLYNNLLVKYREYYDVNELTDQVQVKNMTNLMEKVKDEIKQENKELDNTIKEQYQNINIKLEKFEEDIKQDNSFNNADNPSFIKTAKSKKKKNKRNAEKNLTRCEKINKIKNKL